MKHHFRNRISLILDWQRTHRMDICAFFVLAVMGGLLSYMGAQRLDPVIYEFHTSSTWFEADLPRTFSNMSDRWSDHYRTAVHPLFSLISYSPVFLLQTILNIELITAANIAVATIAALWVGLLFTVLRLIGCHRLEAILFAIVGASSAASLFWFSVAETYSFGSLTILMVLCLGALAEKNRFSSSWYVGIGALSLSITVTNWMAGILANFSNHSFKQSIQLSINAFFLVTVLWAVQKIIFPSAAFFIGSQEEANYILTPESGGPLQVVLSFFYHTMIMPAVDIVDKFNRPQWPVMLTQFSLPGSGGIWGTVAVGIWTILLGFGVWGLFTSPKYRKFRMVLGGILAGQLILHLLYGDETFLYSLHFAPLLVLLVAFGTHTKGRVVVLFLAAAFSITAGVNNYLQFNKAADYMRHNGSARHQVKAQMGLRPLDPWPRGEAHVILAVVGSKEEEKAYHELGANFSPAVNSFGVSIWVQDNEGHITTTSDRLPATKIHQKFVYKTDQEIPGILTETEYYKALWSGSPSEGWKMDLENRGGATSQNLLLIRSVGPAAGKINALSWNKKRLLINNRWSVSFLPLPMSVQLGSEENSQWKNQKTEDRQWEGKDGWGYAKIDFGAAQNWTTTIEDLEGRSELAQTAIIASSLELDLPDQRFAESLNAQVAHLMMGLVGKETRPGDPMNYPLAWQRDGVYVLVALARAGQLDLAKELSVYFAENDFFGGFGAEADAPGSSIWALNEVAILLNDPAYDKWLWPHVKRKADLIIEMLSSGKAVYRSVKSPVVPSLQERPQLFSEINLVAEPAKNGLIIGRMDNHRPLLYVNAVSYAGLVKAALLGRRLNKNNEATTFKTTALKIQTAWENAFHSPQSDNVRTYISALWPSWVAASKPDLIMKGLHKRWKETRDAEGIFLQRPLWTYFDIAEAHQWLFLKDVNKVWSTLEWFWQHQASPNLYTWWESNKEENTYNQWEKVRGWVNPKSVTPHYWSAAEMLLLQLDMLAYIEGSDDRTTLVIGGGIPKKWLQSPLSVKGLLVAGRHVNWNWDGQQVLVQITGDHMDIKLGTSFPTDTPLKIDIAAE